MSAGQRVPSAAKAEHVDSSGDEESSYLRGDEESNTLTPEEWPHMTLDGDTFGLTMCSLVRDSFYLSQGKGKVINRYWRIATTVFLLAFCMGVQIFLLAEVKHFVSAKAVHDVRIAYDRFEHVMYNGHTYELNGTVHTERRGVGGKTGPNFNASRFNDLTEDEKSSACRIPLSQPEFFFFVLYIWTLTCTAELRKCKELFVSMVFYTPTIPNMSQALRPEEPGGDFCDSSPVVVVGMTAWLKMLSVLLVTLPRIGITSYLLWVGSRWLLATTNFSDLILNSCALELLLCLKDLLYTAVVPRRNVLAVENLMFSDKPQHERNDFLSTVLWVLLAGTWVVVYMGVRGTNGLQQVLRDYQWDVHDVCTAWIGERYAV